MNMQVEGAFIYFTIPLFGGIPVTQTVISQLIVTILLCTACVLLGRKLQLRPGPVQVLVEKGVTAMQHMVAESMGEHNLHWTPFIGTVFLCSLCGSLIGLTGFLRPATADLSCTLVWALMVTGIIWWSRIRHSGFSGWLKGFTEPVAVMTPMNIVSEIAQPVSMAFRHFGSLAGGGIITTLLYTALSLASSALLRLITARGWLLSLILIALGLGLTALRKMKRKVGIMVCTVFSTGAGVAGLLHVTGLLPDLPFLSYGIPALLSCYFDLFSGFVQAYVFTLLTMVYIAGSLPAPEDSGA